MNKIVHLSRHLQNILILHYLVLSIFLGSWFNNASAETRMASIFSAQGQVEIRSAGSSAWLPAQANQELGLGASIRTGRTSRAGILFENGVLVRLSELSNIELQALPENSSLRLESGKAHFLSRSRNEFPSIVTPIVTAAIRGTEFVIETSAHEASIMVLDGEVLAENKFGSARLMAGEKAVTKVGQAPVKEIMLRPQDAVTWAAYIPTIGTSGNFSSVRNGASAAELSALNAADAGECSNLEGEASWRFDLARSLCAYKSGDLSKAVNYLAKWQSARLPSVSLLLASFELSAGQIERAETSLNSIETESRAQDPDMQSEIMALRSLIALIKDDKQEASLLSAQAESPLGLLAKSFVDQAKFNLPEALESISRALKIRPNDLGLKARQIELLLSLGEVKRAKELLEEEPEGQDARLDVLRGFAALLFNDISAAESHFKNVLNLDDSMALARLGLGLAFIRAGELASGRKQLEIAVSLDPNNSLFRSYLGKAYFEEDEYELAAQEFGRARNLDPLDPTPELYKAYNELAEFRPVSALRAVEKSIELNDNRAVYRSRLMLDQDLAVRSLGLSEVYAQLGFFDAAREEAIRSLQQDYTNYSAHLLLASANSNRGEQYSLATLSEFFVAQLLAPRNLNFSGNSVDSPGSFNEYATLFDRRRLRVGSQGEYRSDLEGISNEVFQSGTFEDWGYFLDYSTSYVRGYRQNDYDRLHTVFGRAQYQPTYGTTLSSGSLFVAESSGDSLPSFSREGTDPDETTRLRVFSQQLGLRQEISPDTLLIGQAFYSRSHVRFNDSAVERGGLLIVNVNGEPIGAEPFTLFTDREERNYLDTYRAESQIIHQASWGSSLFGLSGTYAENTRIDDGEFIPGENDATDPLFEFDSSLDVSEAFFRAYSYNTMNLSSFMDLDFGASIVHQEYSDRFEPPFDNEDKTLNRFNPKVGFRIEPLKNLQFRGAYFKNVSTVALSELGDIEPSLVSGFNQNILDIPGVRTENFGLAASYKVASSTYLSTEFLHRELERSSSFGVDTATFDFADFSFDGQSAISSSSLDGREQTARTTLNQILSDRWTSTLQHRWVSVEDETIGVPMNSDTLTKSHEVEALLNYFDPSGFVVFGGTTWRHQKRSYFGDEFPDTSDGTSSFWLWQCGLRYQFPNRLGSVQLVVQNALDQDFLYAPLTQVSMPVPERMIGVSYSVTF